MNWLQSSKEHFQADRRKEERAVNPDRRLYPRPSKKLLLFAFVASAAIIVLLYLIMR